MKLNELINSRLYELGKSKTAAEDAAHAGYNAVMNTLEGQNLYRLAIKDNRPSPTAHRANALIDAAMHLAGHPFYVAKDAVSAKNWTVSERAWLALFCEV